MKTRMKAGLFTALLIGGFSTLAQDSFQLDKGHTLVEFNVARFMVGEVTGKFRDFDGTVTLNSKQDLESANITIVTKSLDTDHEVRDGHLRSQIWLDTETHEQITFVSDRVWKKGDVQYISGKLTIRGIENDVEFPYEMQGPFKDPTGMMTVGLKGDLTINRQDYGIKFSKLMDNGELFIGNEVNIRIRALAALKK